MGGTTAISAVIGSVALFFAPNVVAQPRGAAPEQPPPASPPPAAALPPASAPPAAPPARAAAPRSDPAATAQTAPAAPARPPRSGFVGVGRVGFVLGGGGEYELDCSGSPCVGSSFPKRDYDDKSGLVLGADALYHVAPQLRLGAGALFAPKTKMEDEDGDGGLGSDLSLVGIGEAVFDLSPTVAFAARVFAGGVLLFVGDDLEDQNEDVKQSCRAGCKYDLGSNSSFTYGVGAGLIIDAGGVGLRLDLLLQWYSASGRSTELTDQAVGRYEIEEQVSGTRTIAAVGVEF